MKRDIDAVLDAWKDKKNRLPLILRGARQVGKSFAIASFGQRAFEHTVILNFEKTPEIKKCFNELDPKKIVNKLAIFLNVAIVPGKTLLFLDEIQECPEALMAMRYFREECPELHVIAAGSLLEFVLEEQDFRMPVGRVQYLYMRPLSFYEFLQATGHHAFLAHMQQVTVKTGIDDIIHQKGNQLVKQYMAVGGMPAVVQEYLETQDTLNIYRLQASILQTYRDDFPKYATKVQGAHLHRIFEEIPKRVGQQIKYVHIDPTVRSTALKSALFLLAKTGVITPIFSTEGNGVSLSATEKTNLFKCLFLDVGLAVNACKLGADIQFLEDVMTLSKGAIAEQFVGQELIANQDPYVNEPLYFWMRSHAGSQAELDYVLSVNRHVVPVEVKSGKTGRLRSLLQFLSEKEVPFGIKLSQQTLSFDQKVLSVPLYLTAQIPRLVMALREGDFRQ